MVKEDGTAASCWRQHLLSTTSSAASRRTVWQLQRWAPASRRTQRREARHRRPSTTTTTTRCWVDCIRLPPSQPPYPAPPASVLRHTAPPRHRWGPEQRLVHTNRLPAWSAVERCMVDRVPLPDTQPCRIPSASLWARAIWCVNRRSLASKVSIKSQNYNSLQ